MPSPDSSSPTAPKPRDDTSNDAILSSQNTDQQTGSSAPGPVDPTDIVDQPIDIGPLGNEDPPEEVIGVPPTTVPGTQPTPGGGAGISSTPVPGEDSKIPRYQKIWQDLKSTSIAEVKAEAKVVAAEFGISALALADLAEEAESIPPPDGPALAALFAEASTSAKYLGAALALLGADPPRTDTSVIATFKPFVLNTAVAPTSSNGAITSLVADLINAATALGVTTSTIERCLGAESALDSAGTNVAALEKYGTDLSSQLTVLVDNLIAAQEQLINVGKAGTAASASLQQTTSGLKSGSQSSTGQFQTLWTAARANLQTSLDLDANTMTALDQQAQAISTSASQSTAGSFQAAVTAGANALAGFGHDVQELAGTLLTAAQQLNTQLTSIAQPPVAQPANTGSSSKSTGSSGTQPSKAPAGGGTPPTGQQPPKGGSKQ
jgi:predicted small secreted protein